MPKLLHFDSQSVPYFLRKIYIHLLVTNGQLTITLYNRVGPNVAVIFGYHLCIKVVIYKTYDISACIVSNSTRRSATADCTGRRV